MKKLKLDDDARTVYDIQYATKPLLFLKDIGNYCEICKKHLFNKRSKTCSNKCRKIKYRQTNLQQNNSSLQARISSKKYEGDLEYRILGIYLKKGVIHKIKITEKDSELWNTVESIQKFRSKHISEIVL